jgi:hypothetical protein
LREAAHKLAGIVAAFSTLAASAASELEGLAAANQLEDAAPAACRIHELGEKLLRELNRTSIAKLRQQIERS